MQHHPGAERDVGGEVSDREPATKPLPPSKYQCLSLIKLTALNRRAAFLFLAPPQQHALRNFARDGELQKSRPACRPADQQAVQPQPSDMEMPDSSPTAVFHSVRCGGLFATWGGMAVGFEAQDGRGGASYHFTLFGVISATHGAKRSLWLRVRRCRI